MRYRITAPIQGELFVGERRIFAEKENFQFELICNNSGKVTHISINTIVPDDKRGNFRSNVEPLNGKAKFSIHIGGDGELFDMLCDRLRVVETELAFSTRGGLWRILWNDISTEFIPEDNSDEELLSVIGFSTSKGYSGTPTKITANVFNTIVDLADDKSPLLVSKSFWQEGMNFFHAFNYIQAFYSFFFILEGIFAEGKTSQEEVVKRFERSQEFTEAAKYCFATLQKEERHHINLQRFFDEEKIEFDVKNLPIFLFRMRGRTHHFSGKNQKLQATPYNQKNFESIALLTMAIASFILANRTENYVKERSHHCD